MENLKHPDDVDQLIQNDTNYQSYVMAHNGWVMMMIHLFDYHLDERQR